jgi:hypothetical protein
MLVHFRSWLFGVKSRLTGNRHGATATIFRQENKRRDCPHAGRPKAAFRSITLPHITLIITRVLFSPSKPNKERQGQSTQATVSGLPPRPGSAYPILCISLAAVVSVSTGGRYFTIWAMVDGDSYAPHTGSLSTQQVNNDVPSNRGRIAPPLLRGLLP